MTTLLTAIAISAMNSAAAAELASSAVPYSDDGHRFFIIVVSGVEVTRRKYNWSRALCVEEAAATPTLLF